MRSEGEQYSCNVLEILMILSLKYSYQRYSYLIKKSIATMCESKTLQVFHKKQCIERNC